MDDLGVPLFQETHIFPLMPSPWYEIHLFATEGDQTVSGLFLWRKKSSGKSSFTLSPVEFVPAVEGFQQNTLSPVGSHSCRNGEGVARGHRVWGWHESTTCGVSTQKMERRNVWFSRRILRFYPFLGPFLWQKWTPGGSRKRPKVARLGATYQSPTHRLTWRHNQPAYQVPCLWRLLFWT